jgi:hypothetical protein
VRQQSPEGGSLYLGLLRLAQLSIIVRLVHLTLLK